RRRHTRSKRDWSSDVCSSDLEIVVADAVAGWQHTGEHGRPARPGDGRNLRVHAHGPVETGGGDGVQVWGGHLAERVVPDAVDARSEERRVGKEGRPRVESCRG